METRQLVENWIEALESGEFRQSQSQLRYTEPDGDYSYCAIGVLGELLEQEGSFKWDDCNPEALYEIVNVIGAQTTNPIFNIKKARYKHYLSRPLWNMNDCEHRTFPEIAQWLQKQVLERLPVV